MTCNRLAYPVAVLATALAVAIAVAASAQERVHLEDGEFEYMVTTTGVLIAVARKLGSGYLVFRGG